MMRATKIVLLTLVVVVGVAILGVWMFLKRGLSARPEPSRLEERVARIARGIATPAEARTMENPVPATPANMAAAKEHYVEHCAACHALDGSGETILGRNMYPRAPDLRRSETQNLADGELHYIISEGVRFTGMPAFGGDESTVEIWQLVPFLRRLPHLSEEELKELETMAGGDRDDVEGADRPPHEHR
jgi:mono/diheme cytochrome c family protein